MLKSMPRLLILAAALGYGSSAFALVDVQLEHGRRWESRDSSGVAFSQTMLAAHLGFLPIVSFGASYSLFQVSDTDKKSQDLKSLTGTEIGLDVTAQLSFVPIITPYARFNLPLISTFEGKYDSGDTRTAAGVPLESYSLTAGAKYSILPFFSLMAEVGTGVSMAKLTKASSNGVDVLAEDPNYKNRTASKIDQFRVGIEFDLGL